MIRKAIHEDIQKVYDIDQDVLSAHWTKDDYLSILDNQNYVFLVISSSDDIQGFIVIRKGLDDSDLMQIALRKNAQAMGLGSLLLQEACSLIPKNKPLLLEVENVNISAQRFYESKGFERIATRKNYYENGNDAYIYRKVI